jgi:Patatin-like phospholipase
MKLFGFLYKWAWKRLPRGFSIPLLIMVVAYFAAVFPWLVYRGGPVFVGYIVSHVSFRAFTWEFLHGQEIISALITVFFTVFGLVACYGCAGQLYRLVRGRAMSSITIHKPVLPSYTGKESGEDNPLKRYERIGIILAGGGAKGAYQAGAMKAIYEFLDKHQAHHKVRMIAGTSIGSWNALFWLAGMIKGPEGADSVHEQWWHHVDAKSIVRPAFYWPAQQNYFLSNEPWQETFSRFFLQNREAKERLL